MQGGVLVYARSYLLDMSDSYSSILYCVEGRFHICLLSLR